MQYRQLPSIASEFRGSLRGLCVDRADRLYAAGDSLLKLFEGGAVRQRWTTAKPALSVAVSDEGLLYAGEAGQIELFDGAGKLVNTWRDSEKLGQVSAIGFHKNTVLAADSKDRSIRRFDKSGAFLGNIGKDNKLKGFLIPNGALDFSVDREGTIHAANPGKHRVERYSPAGALLGHIGRFGQMDDAGFRGCCNPTNVTLGPGGVYVTEKAGPRAKLFALDGTLRGVIATKELDPDCKNIDIAVDSRGRVYLGDTVKLQILVFEAL